MEQKSAPLAQMTIKAVGADPKDAIRQNAQVFLCRIFGECTDAKTKEARNGDAYTYLIGSFRAERPSKTDDEKKGGPVVIFTSEKLFLPGGIQEKVESQVKTSGGKPVQFGYDLYSGPDANVTVGYRYAAQAIIETASTDRLSAMALELNKKPMPGMEVPKSAAKEEVKEGAKKK